MKSRLLMAVSVVMCSCLVSVQNTDAAGPLAGDWVLTVVKSVGAPAPFSGSGSLFRFTEELVFQAQNTPAGGAPLCTMSGERSGTILSGTEVCGLPRSSFGAFMGIVNSDTNPRNMYMFWADSQGVYLIIGQKVR